MLKPLSVAALALTVAAAGLPSFASAAQPPPPAPPPPPHHHVVHHRHVAYNNCKHAAHQGTTGGAIIGALAGQALGHNTTSTVLGGVAGAAAGHNINYDKCRDRHR